MNRQLYFSIVVMIALLNGCATEEYLPYTMPSSQAEVAIIRPLSSSPETYRLRDYLTIERIVPLEYGEESALYEASKAIWYQDKLYILDRTASILKVFASDGRYLFDMGGIGRGPGEYTQLADFDFDSVSQTFLLYGTNRMSLLRFRADGTFIGAEKLPFFGDQFVVLDSSFYAFYINFNSSNHNDSHNLLITDRYLNVYRKAFRYQYDGPGLSFVGGFSRGTGRTLYSDAYKDTVFEIHADYAKPAYIFQYEGPRLPEDINSDMQKVYEALKYSFHWHFLENQQAFCFEYFHQKKMRTALWLREKRILLQDSNSDPENFFLTLGLPIGWINGDTFVAALTPDKARWLKYKAREYLEGFKADFPALYDTILQLEVDANPVLVFFQVL